jgi:hypothetical protein
MTDLLEEFAPGGPLVVGVERAHLALGDGPVAQVLPAEEWTARMDEQDLQNPLPTAV